MSLKILVVEDHEIVRKVLFAILTAEGYQPTLALNGEEAIECFETNRYDLIFMDIGLPGISGCLAAKYIREKERASPDYIKDVPIVALTAHMDRHLAQRSHSTTELDDWINVWSEKPLTLQGLQNLLEGLHLIPTRVA